MFSNQKPGERSASSEGGRSATTVIARGVKVEGEFSSVGDVVIEGDVQGHISASGLLTIGTEAHIRADVRAGEAHIAGSIEGNVVVDKRLVLKSTANITGDVTAATISIEEGACVVGKFTIGTKTGHTEAALPSGTRPMRNPQATVIAMPKSE